MKRKPIFICRQCKKPVCRLTINVDAEDKSCGMCASPAAREKNMKNPPAKSIVNKAPLAEMTPDMQKEEVMRKVEDIRNKCFKVLAANDGVKTFYELWTMTAVDEIRLFNAKV